MRAEKKLITSEYVARLNASPFFIVVDYVGLTVAQFGELRKRLRTAGAEVHVVKNSIFRIAAKEAGVAELNGSLAGQLAVVTGQKDVSAAAKVVKKFQAEFEKPKIKFGYLENKKLEKEQVEAIADLPSLNELRSQLVGLIQAPLQGIVGVLAAPARDLVSVLRARLDKEKEGAAA
jgi:large subunit ribosomal protein L10